MELSVKQCLRQRIRSGNLWAWSLLIWGIPSQIICFPKAANSLPSPKQQETAVPIFSQENDLYEAIPENIKQSAGEATAAEFPEASVISLDTESQSVNKSGNLNKNAQMPDPPTPANESGNPDTNINTSPQQPSVSQLSDVQPSDWAYQALRSLMERYGVLSGYPDHTFGGNRPLSRYEFAAGLAATMDKLDSLIGSGFRDEFIQQDLITLRRLEREYRSALDDLAKRLNKMDDRVTRLEAHRFSATTKLQGQAIVAFTQGSGANSTIVSRERLNLLTSFNSNDLLLTQLEAGNNGDDAIGRAQKSKNLNLLGTSGLIASGGGLDYVDVDSAFKLRRLYYSFRPASDLSVSVGAKMSPRDFIDRNRYANNEAVDFSSSFFINNPLIVQNQIDRYGGAGVAISWNPGGSALTIRSLYIAADANVVSSNGSGGLFKDRYQASAEVEYSLSNQLALRLQYTRAEINNTDINAFGVNAEYALNRNLGIFTRLGFGNYQGFNTAINQNLDINPFSWAVGFGIRNLGIPGTVGGIAVGQPFVTDGLGNTTQTNIEAFYNLELSDNVSITPIFSVVTNANNDSSNNTIWQGALRTVISF
ncbi:porin [Brasilonema octagenarum UFV-E1]|uniref:Porin n=1 Tax=Brasilonema sennae CENA114 TaxID=415709 RepID=A0A856MQI7_9CYAN|nr:iron uptake porin [Brasilonema sennae]QDL11861.1 porin [Brasilonema sennae CENA114]QDL18241.1 porin [Brasilonema octagenarum UFV-E1]